LLASAAGHFGKTARTPMLWIYTENDSYFAPSIARAMYHSFTSAGGVADFEQPGPYGTDGHRLFFWPECSNVSNPDDHALLTFALAATIGSEGNVPADED
jgi:hypothetical protein